VFEGNADDTGVVVASLPRPIPGVFALRVIPRSWSGDDVPSLRVDVIGCYEVIATTTTVATVTTTTSGESVKTTEIPAVTTSTTEVRVWSLLLYSHIYCMLFSSLG